MIVPRKILALKLRALGDTVLMTAPLAELRRAFPEAEIHVAVTSSWAPLLENHPGVNRIWKYERHRERTARAKAVARLALRLRRERYDCVVNFHASPSSAAIAYGTGAPVRAIHFHGHKDRNRFSTVEVPGKGIIKPVIERDMDTVRALGLHVPAGRLPQIVLQGVEIEEARARISGLGLESPVLGLGLGASRPSKSWPIERFAAAALLWRQRTRGGVLALVGSDEEKLAQEFMRAIDDALTAEIPELPARSSLRAGICVQSGLPLRQVAALIRECRVFLANDSGLRHVAVAVGAPTVTIFGPEDPFEWHPYPRDLHPYFFVEGLPCRRDALPGFPPWCGVQVCVEEQHRCMKQIGFEPVIQECERFGKKAAWGSQTVPESQSQRSS